MAILRHHLPSDREIALVFTACVFPVHVWTIINVLREVPAWVLRLSAWELVGVISYALVVALLESVLFLLGLVLLGVLLPPSVLGDGFVAQDSMVVLLTTLWAIVAHYNDDVIRLWGLRQFALGGIAYLLSLVLGYGLVRRFQALKRAFNSVVERLSLLSWVYLFADLTALVVVFVRNV